MPSSKPQLRFVIDKKLLAQVDRYWHKHGFKSRSAAIIWLIRFALRYDPAPPDPDEYIE